MIAYIFEEEIEKKKDYIAIDLIYQGKFIPKVFNLDDSILALKDALYNAIPDIENKDIFFLYNGIVLSEMEKTFRDYAITSGDKILVGDLDNFVDFNENKGEKKDEFIIVQFISTDQLINIAIRGNKFAPLYILENELYNMFPDYRNKNCYFLANGWKCDKNKTLEENKIENGDKLIVVINEDEEEN